MTNQPSKDSLRAAQQRHQALLFGAPDNTSSSGAPSARREESADEAAAVQPAAVSSPTPAVKPPPVQQAVDQHRERARTLGQAASRKRRQLSTEEQTVLNELEERSKGRPQPDQPPSDQPAPAAPRPATTPSGSDLTQVSKRNDLAAAALQNMRNHRQRRPSAPSVQSPAPVSPRRAPTPAAPAAAPPATENPAPAQTAPARANPPTGPSDRDSTRPSPEELAALLRQMAQRRAPAAGQPPAGTAARSGGPERGGEYTPEAPPTPPEGATEREAEREKEYAEKLEQLKAKEAHAQEAAPSLPTEQQSERAIEGPVEATFNQPQVTGNAIPSDMIYRDLEVLREAMRVKDAGGQVSGANQLQRNLPGHPLYQPPDHS